MVGWRTLLLGLRPLEYMANYSSTPFRTSSAFPAHIISPSASFSGHGREKQLCLNDVVSE